MANLAQLIYAIQDDANREVRDSEDLKFIGHCLANASDTYSQNYQDVFALYATDYMKNGYFVDFGATDGKTINNTYLLEKRYGWKGIVAEPNSYWHNDLIKNRFGHISFDCVYSETGKEIEFIASDTPDISGIKEFWTWLPLLLSSHIIMLREDCLNDTSLFSPPCLRLEFYLKIKKSMQKKCNF